MDKSEKLKSRQIKKAAVILKSGGVIVFPTDTVYGIGAIISNKKAIKRIYKIKQTPKSQNFPILITDIAQIEDMVIFSDTAKSLAKKYWPGALTLIMKLKNSKNKIGIRMPDSDIIRSLLAETKKPIIGTSANIHGQKTPTVTSQLDPKIKQQADFVIDGECGKKIQSTVVDATVNPPKILRYGAVNIGSIKNITLKIDTIKMLATEVILEDGSIGKIKKLTSTQTKGSQVLLPMIIKILKLANRSFEDLTAIEVNPGPGSFTGTRVGVAVANTLGFALDLPVNGKKGKIVEPIYEKSKFD